MDTLRLISIGSGLNKSLSLEVPVGATVQKVSLYGSSGLPHIPVEGNWEGPMETRYFALKQHGDELPVSRKFLGAFRKYALYEII